MAQGKSFKGKSEVPAKSGPIEGKLLQQIYTDFLVNTEAQPEDLPTVLKILSSYQLVKWCFGSTDGGGAGDQRTGQIWCQKLKSMLASPQGGNINVHAKNIIIACKIIAETVEQSQAAFICGVQDWATELLRCLSKPNLGSEVICQVIETLSGLIQLTLDRPEIQREITTNILPQFNQKLIDFLEKNEEFSNIYILEALRDSLKYFPKGFRNLVARFKRILLASWLSSEESKAFLLQEGDHTLLAQLTFECLVLLTSTERSMVAISEGFIQHFSSLVATGHAILNEILYPVQEDLYQETSLSYPIAKLDFQNDESFVDNLIALNRFRLVCHAIVCCLNFQPQLALGNPLSIPLNEIMNLLCRVYTINANSMSIDPSQSKELLNLLSVLPTLHAAAHDVTIVLCRRAGTGGLMEKTKLFSDIVQKLLHFSQPHSEIRNSAYCLIYHMVDALRDGLLYHSQDALLTSVLEELELKEQASMMPKSFLATGANKKGKRTVLTNSDALINGDNSVKPSKNYAVSMLILEMNLQSSFPIDSDLRLKMDMLLFRHSSLVLSGELKLDGTQQLAISKVLLASSLNPSSSQAILVEVAQAVFSSALLHPCSQIRHHSISALAQLNTLIRPQLPSLHTEKMFVSDQATGFSDVLVSVAPSLPVHSNPTPSIEDQPCPESVQSISPKIAEPLHNLPVTPELMEISGLNQEISDNVSLKRSHPESCPQSPQIPDSPRKRHNVEASPQITPLLAEPLFNFDEKLKEAESDDSDDEIPQII